LSEILSFAIGFCPILIYATLSGLLAVDVFDDFFFAARVDDVPPARFFIFFRNTQQALVDAMHLERYFALSEHYDDVAFGYAALEGIVVPYGMVYFFHN
jgi:hypothetical protein